VLEAIEKENLIEHAAMLGQWLMDELRSLPRIREVRGRGLMIGIDLPESLAGLRRDLLFREGVFTGEAKPNVVRLLPSLALTRREAGVFLKKFKACLSVSA